MRQKTSPQDRRTSTAPPRRVTRSMTVRNDEANSVRKHRPEGGGRSRSSHIPSHSSGLRQHTNQPQSRHVFPNIDASAFGLIQESIAHNLYFLVLQAILWNQTSGIKARPVFFVLIERYPDPEHLSEASLLELTALLRPLGLHNIRARRCIALASCWNQSPPTATRQYFRKGYPGGPTLLNTSLGYEIAHLPGVGPYALDSFRIFHRDEMRGLAEDWLGTGATLEGFEPEWKRVLPQDKELRAYIKWRWLKEGVTWDDKDGHRCYKIARRTSVAGKTC